MWREEKICGEARAGGVYIEASGEREAPAGSEPFSALALIWRRRRAAGERRVWKGEGRYRLWASPGDFKGGWLSGAVYREHSRSKRDGTSTEW